PVVSPMVLSVAVSEELGLGGAPVSVGDSLVVPGLLVLASVVVLAFAVGGTPPTPPSEGRQASATVGSRARARMTFESISTRRRGRCARAGCGRGRGSCGAAPRSQMSVKAA